MIFKIYSLTSHANAHAGSLVDLSRIKTLMSFVRVWAISWCIWLPYALIQCLWSFCVCAISFCAAVMTKTYVSRCWDSRTKFWWALCVSEPMHLILFVKSTILLCCQFSNICNIWEYANCSWWHVIHIALLDDELVWATRI
jgi:hypothetical protein